MLPSPSNLYSPTLSRAASVCWIAVVLLASCTHWAGQDLSADRLIASKHPDRIRVTRAGGQRLVMTSPRIEGDSLVGMIENTSSGTSGAVALADVRGVEVRRINVGATVGLAAAAGVTAIVVAATSGGGDAPPSSPPGGGYSCTYCSSCPLVYSWDGAHWRLDSGTFGGAIVRALQRTDVDNLDFVTAQNGSVRLDVRNELSETDYIDGFSVVAVDHDTSVKLAPDPQGNLHTVGPLLEPVRGTDYTGRDVLARVRRTDGWNWESAPRPRNPADASELRDGIELAFVRPAGASSARLVVDARNTPWAAYLLAEFVRAHGAGTGAWYDLLNRHPRDARAFGLRVAHEAFLRAELKTDRGWESVGFFWEAGPEVVKRQVLVLDLSHATGDSVYVRLDAPPSFWLIDHAALALGPDQPSSARDLELLSARDRNGHDVRSALAAIDGSYLTLETGEGAELRYRDVAPAAGKRRSYFLRSTGWYQLHTPSTGPEAPALLAQVETDPQGISRVSVVRMNEALAAMARGTY